MHLTTFSSLKDFTMKYFVSSSSQDLSSGNAKKLRTKLKKGKKTTLCYPGSVAIHATQVPWNYQKIP